MAKLWDKTINITSNPSGAAIAARQGHIVVIVDIIDMSTTAETALENGALETYGAAPDSNNSPVAVNPEKIGYFVAKKAMKAKAEIIIAAEPRLMSNPGHRSTIDGIKLVENGINRAGTKIKNIIPNLGKEIGKLTDFKDSIVIIVSSAGGVCFDAAYNFGAPEVLTGTVARTTKMKGNKPAAVAAERAISTALKYQTGISIVAASSNAMEDILAADYIAQEIIKRDFLKLDK